MRKWTLFVFAIAASVCCFGCGGDDDNGSNPNPTDVVVEVHAASTTQGVGLVIRFSATVTGATDTTVSWYVNNVPGGDSATVGSITPNGRYRAPDVVPASDTVVVKAVSVKDPRAYDSFELAIVSGNGTGLPATYSNGMGPLPLEAPINHGYSWDCTATDYNMYQGECIEVDASPVDWADGSGWSVSWTGQLFVPRAGDYRFASRYWVDGIVLVSVNGTVIANLNTTGASYSNTVTLPGNTWVPILMTFSPNGGSHNMILGWVTPGGEWSLVTRSYLKP